MQPLRNCRMAGHFISIIAEHVTRITFLKVSHPHSGEAFCPPWLPGLTSLRHKYSWWPNISQKGIEVSGFLMVNSYIRTVIFVAIIWFSIRLPFLFFFSSFSFSTGVSFINYQQRSEICLSCSPATYFTVGGTGVSWVWSCSVRHSTFCWAWRLKVLKIR